MAYKSSLRLILFILFSEISVLRCATLEEFSPMENGDFLQGLKEELDSFRVDLTKSFMEKHSRGKRAAAGEVSDIEISKSFLEIQSSFVGPFSTFTFSGEAYVIQRDGIYRVDRLSDVVANQITSPEKMLSKVSSWRLDANEVVLHGQEWRHKFFFLTTTGKVSTIYTIHDTNLTPVFRQRIHNKGKAVAAEFFEYRKNFYLAASNDNDLHSQTFSTISRWAGSYMDEIHQVQTTGSTTVKAFTINSKQYIAFGQTRDSSGNTQLGTMVLSMDHKESLERVQLLWSDAAVDLQYMETEKEHFLVIGQEKEPSIVYWFGGMDFIFWQQLDGFQGKDMVMDGLQLTTDEPILLGSDGGLLQFFSRSASTAKIQSSWVSSKSVDMFSSERVSSTDQIKISQIKFLHVGSEKPAVFLAVTKKVANLNKEFIRLHPVNIVKRQLAISQAKESGDKLSQCLQSLSTSLKEAEPVLTRIEEVGPSVLRSDMDVDFEGTLISKKIVKMDPTKSKVANAQISPVAGRAGNADPIETSPARLQNSILESNTRLEQMKSELKDLFYKTSETNTVTGNWEFSNPVQFHHLQANGPTDLKTETINNVKWSDLENSVLKLVSDQPQQVSGSWNLETFSTTNINIENKDSTIFPSKFMQKSCSTNQQTVTGVNQFTKRLAFAQGINLDPTVNINGIPFSDVVFKNSQQDIRGYKHAQVVQGNYIAENIDDVRLPEWFLEVAKINTDEKQVFTGPVKVLENAALQLDNVKVEEVNSQNWDEFQSNVMLNGADQQIKGAVNFLHLKADNFQTETISGVKSESLLTSVATQNVISQITVKHLHVSGPLMTSGLINTVSLADVVKRDEPQVEINGPVTLENFQVQEVVVPEGVTIAEKDVSELAALKKTHIYSTAQNAPIFIQQVNVDKLSTSSLGGVEVSDFGTNFWSKSGDNVANAVQLILSERDVSSKSFITETLNDFSFPNEFISLDQVDGEAILVNAAKLIFEKPVTVLGSVTMTDGAKIQDIDMSEAQSIIVDETFTGIVRGTKTFADSIVATDGAGFGELNGMDLLNDVVMLSSTKTQVIDGSLEFKAAVNSQEFTVQNGNVLVNGLVNEVNLEDVKHTTAFIDQENSFEAALVFEKGIKVDKLAVDQLNSFHVRDVTENLVFLDSIETQTIEGGLEVENADVTFHADSLTRDINGVHVFQYLSQVVSLSSSETNIVGKKTFTNAVMNAELMCASFNGVDLVNLEENAFSKSKDQSVEGQWVLEDAVFQENMKTTVIGRVSLENLVFTDEPFQVTSAISFTSTVVQGPFSVKGVMNGINFDKEITDLLTIDSTGRFDVVTVNGNLDWATGQPQLQKLTYLFENAVKNSGEQTILGPVTFSKGFKSSSLSSPNEWLGNVNLQEIVDDAVFKDSSEWILTGNNRVPNQLQIGNLINPVETLDVKDVNKINLREMNEDIVRKTDDRSTVRIIQGHKELNGEIKINNLQIHEELAELLIQDLVIKNDGTEINEVHFKDLTVNQDFDWQSSSDSGINIKLLLDDRVSLTRPDQKLDGTYAFNDVVVKQQCLPEKINEVTVKNTLQRDSLNVPQISGKKILKENLVIDGDLNTPALNSHPIQQLIESTLQTDREEVILRPVIFQSPVIVNQVADVNSINDVNLKTLSTSVSERVGRMVTEAQNPEQLANELKFQSSRLRTLAEERPVWFEYLRLKQDWTSLGPSSKVDHIRRTNAGDILVTLHQDTKEQDVVVMTIPDKQAGLVPQAIGTDNCLKIYHVSSPTGRAYTVTSETPSADTTCITEEADQKTKIFDEKGLIGELTLDHISDVGIFSTDPETDYLVLARYFDTETESHSTTTHVIRVSSSGILETVQEITTHGVKKVSLSEINSRWMLAIANSKNSADPSSCNSDSAIYSWSKADNSFLLLRTIMTDGAFDVEFITAETSSEFYKQSFVAFAQEGNSAAGEIMIFKFQQPGGNFELSQTIRSNWPVTALRTSCFCHQCFLMTTVPQEGVAFYENRFIEGFQRTYKVPLFGATDINSFTVNQQHLLAIATNKGPILAEAVVAGSC